MTLYEIDRLGGVKGLTTISALFVRELLIHEATGEGVWMMSHRRGLQFTA